MQMEQQLFHVYKKNSHTTEVIAHSLTVEQLEEKLIDKTVDMRVHEIQPCYIEYTDASY